MGLYMRSNRTCAGTGPTRSFPGVACLPADTRSSGRSDISLGFCSSGMDRDLQLRGYCDATGRRAGIIFASLPLGHAAGTGRWLSQIPGRPSWERCSSFFLLLGLRLVLRTDWLAAVVLWRFFSALKSLALFLSGDRLPTTVLVYAIAALIVFASAWCRCMRDFYCRLLANLPFSADFFSLVHGTSMFALIGVVALAAWGFYNSWAASRYGKRTSRACYPQTGSIRTRPVP